MLRCSAPYDARTRRFYVSIPPVLVLRVLQAAAEVQATELTVWSVLATQVQPNAPAAAANPDHNEHLDLVVIAAARLLSQRLRGEATILLKDVLPESESNLKLIVPANLELQKLTYRVDKNNWERFIHTSQPGCYINAKGASFADTFVLFEVAAPE